MEQETDRKFSNGDESNSERDLAAMISNRISRETDLGFDSLPENLRYTVRDYISDDAKDPAKFALLGKQPITLCLSQHAKLKLGSCWHFGFLSPKDRWESSMSIKVDHDHLIKDYRECLDLLSRGSLPYYSVFIKILVFQLDLSQNFSRALKSLQNTLVRLKDHLNSVTHVVVAIGKDTFCCFAFKDAIDNATRLPQAIERQVALKQILHDLRTCLKSRRKLNTKVLLDFYIFKDVKPLSDRYLSKLVISLNDVHCADLFDAAAPALKSSKLMGIYYLETLDELNHVSPSITRHCHAIFLEESKRGKKHHVKNRLKPAFGLKGSHAIKRGVNASKEWDSTMKLPRPRFPLADSMAFSALIELSLNGPPDLTLHLAILNSGHFQNLAHLSVIGGTITGHLNSHCVPRLKTLKIEPQSTFVKPYGEVNSHVQKCCQSLIDSGHPWQLVATQSTGGWSLASYDELTITSHDEAKESSPQSPPYALPLIKELMLVMSNYHHTDEWESKLNGILSPEADADDHHDCLLVWAPERVEKITVFSYSEWPIYVEFHHFQRAIPGRKRILSSLTSHNVNIRVDGAGMPNLQSLDANYSWVTLSGTFPQLRKLSFRNGALCAPCQLDAPLLQSLHCHQLCQGQYLLLSLQLLPHLSSLQIELWNNHPALCPRFLDNEYNLELPRLKHIVFGVNVTLAPYLDQYPLNHVLHLELTVCQSQLPACWSNNTVWQCETLTIDVFGMNSDDMKSIPIPTTLMLPPLPLVRKLTVKEKDCHVLLNSEMPELTECSVPSPESFGPNLRCPALRSIHFTHIFPGREKCSDPTTYVAIGARPRGVYLDFDGEVIRMSWDVTPSVTGKSSFSKAVSSGWLFFCIIVMAFFFFRFTQ